jgi:hypothetical protein
MSCNEGPRSRFPNGLAFNAAFRNLDAWVRKGKSPPRVAPIEVADGKAVLDYHGNVRGGIRSPFVDVPTATWTGSSTGASFCFIAGHEIPFDKAKLKLLYPKHSNYASDVQRSVNALVREGTLLREDGAELVREARRASVP